MSDNGTASLRPRRYDRTCAAGGHLAPTVGGAIRGIGEKFARRGVLRFWSTTHPPQNPSLLSDAPGTARLTRFSASACPHRRPRQHRVGNRAGGAIASPRVLYDSHAAPPHEERDQR